MAATEATRASEAPDVTYDVLVLGAGPTGENVADRAHADGLSVAIVESELVGGECSYWACMPSKALLRPVTARSEARRVPGLADAAAGPLDAPAVLARRDDVVGHWKDDGQVRWLDAAGIDLVRGHARLAGPRRVSVDGRTLAARHAVAVCTGSRPVLPPVPGLAAAKPWTSRDATSAKTVPGRLVVVGGGVVGVEMATAWRALGASVTLLVRGDGLLPRMEPFAGRLVAESLAEAGVFLRTGVEVREVRREAPGGPVTVVLDSAVSGGSGGSGDEIVADELLIATGRAPRTDDLGLETVGLEPGSWLRVDDSCLVTDVPGGWLYGVGDVNRRALLTHQGKYQARIAGAAIAARARQVPILDSGPWGAHAATADTAAVPQVVFSDPEAASVGLTAAAAERAGHRIRVVDQDLGAVAGAFLYADGYRGRARMIVDLDREILLGATFVGHGVGELLHSATVAVAGEVPIERLWHAVPAYPTISEVWLRLLEAYRSQGPS
ncbi:dihydrolipoyl dehydrogenase family protein [Streptomyces chattanoogensis]|uniref:dihydrolipoyl dehydrogenase family protein n=1 Tax=Streptomyces chattanoogensis TaxID=66876 RepID=UPI0036C3F0F5